MESVEGKEAVVSAEDAVAQRRAAKMRARSREYAARKRKELYLVKERALLVYAELVKLGVYGKLSPEAREFFSIYISKSEMDGHKYPPTIYKMFGCDPAVGVSCSLREAMQRLYKGKNEINFMLRRWYEKHGIDVVYEPAEDGNALEGRYVIKAMTDTDKHLRVEDVKEIMSDREMRWYRAREARLQG